MVQLLSLSAFTVVAPVSIPGQGTKIPQAMRHSQINKQKINKSFSLTKKNLKSKKKKVMKTYVRLKSIRK